MTDTRTDLQIDHELLTPRAMAGYMPIGTAPIVPKRSIAGRALVARLQAGEDKGLIALRVTHSTHGAHTGDIGVGAQNGGHLSEMLRLGIEGEELSPGVIVAGERTNEIFIENGRFHGRLIADDLIAKLSPTPLSV